VVPSNSSFFSNPSKNLIIRAYYYCFNDLE
jgi:hypothetical protein